MSNEIAVKEKSALSWNKSQIDLIKRTVAKGSTNDEFNMFMYLAKTYQLDPMTKEIWFIKYNEKAVPIIMTSRDGYLAIANRNSHYKGLISDVVHENDEFEKLTEEVKHKYGCKDRGKIIGAYALGYRDDREYPVYVYAHFDEYFKKNSSIWTQYGSAMILKCAEAMMFKRLFSISGLVTKEEIAIEKDDGTIDMPFEPQREGQVTKSEEKIIDKVLDEQEIDRNDEAIEEVEVIEEEKAKQEADEVPMDIMPASDKQKDYIYGLSQCKECKKEFQGFKCPYCGAKDTKEKKYIKILKKGIIHSDYIETADIIDIGAPNKLDIAKANEKMKWWWGDKDKNIIGEREKREKNPKTGESDLERRGTLMQEVLALMKKNYIYKPMKMKMYKKFQKGDIKQLTTEELEILKGELEHYRPEWAK